MHYDAITILMLSALIRFFVKNSKILIARSFTCAHRHVYEGKFFFFSLKFHYTI